MIISRSNGFIFVHVPKTAGTSISSFLSSFTSEEERDLLKRWQKHRTAAEIATSIGSEEFDRLFSFGVVRNPFNWLFSLYTFLRVDFRNWPGSRVMDRLPRFTDFVTSDLFQNTPRGAEAPFDSVGRLLSPQSFWLCDAGGRVMVDQVIKFEQLDADFQAVCRQLSLPQPQELERINVGGQGARRPWLRRLLRRVQGRPYPLSRTLSQPRDSLSQAYADPWARALVAERYASDFKTFGYDPTQPP